MNYALTCLPHTCRSLSEALCVQTNIWLFPWRLVLRFFFVKSINQYLLTRPILYYFSRNAYRFRKVYWSLTFVCLSIIHFVVLMYINVIRGSLFSEPCRTTWQRYILTTTGCQIILSIRLWIKKKINCILKNWNDLNMVCKPVLIAEGY